ncbi:MAG TPA: CehA/McbA family metallohydrolase [Thermoguttaceae bacterium]|nr:CehA/McbA family metallohydrolase [Thermoguttaceae bacterium]
MRPFYRLAVFGLLIATLFSATSAPAAEPVDLLSNGGFEEGLIGWSPDLGHSLVTESGVARSGRACLAGEVTGPNQALRLQRRVSVRAGNRYEFEIYAKATNRTKLVLWATPPGSSTRQSIASWENVTPQWRRYAIPISIAQNGMLGLEIIAPSSHNAPVGRMWIDDVALYETEMPPVVCVSEGVGFHDEPAMARAADGSIYVAYNGFRQGTDSLQVARYRLLGKTFQAAGNWQVLGGEGVYLLGPEAVSTGENIAIVYAAEKDKCWDIYAVTCGPDGPGEPVAVTADAAVDVKPAAAWHDGTLWIAWESSRQGCRRILAASLRDGRVSEPVALSPAGSSAYGPSVAVLESGEVCVAWHSFRENNYDVFLRRKSAGGDWGRETRLTRAPSIDRHPMLFARGDELWMVYENAQTERYSIGRTNRRRLVVAKITAGGLLTPNTVAASPLDGRCEAPSAAFDAHGRLWISMLRPRLPRAGWDTVVTCFADRRWLQPVPVSSQKGMDRRPRLVLQEGRAFVAFQADDMPQSWSDLDQMAASTSHVYLAALETGSMTADSAMWLEPLVESDEPFEPAEIRLQRGEDTPTQTIEYNGRELKLFFGDLHEHTDISVCNRVGDQSSDESYQHMRDIARYDFACVTDHGYNFNPYLWNYAAKMVRVSEDSGRFLTFLGEEWTSTFEEYSQTHPYGFYGHRNLILADPYFPRFWNARNRQTPTQVWEDLRKLDADFVHIPHQLADTGNVPTDWNFTDEKAQPVAEIFQTRGSYEHQGTPREAGRTTPPGHFLQDAWARGIVIGVIAAPDHGGGYGKACVFAPELTREAILEAIRQRHCYGTTAAKIFLDVRVDGHLMGEKLETPAGESVKLEIVTRCPGEIQRIDVCRNNRFLYTESPEGREMELTYIDRDPLPGRSYYYVRVIQKDEEIAWSSPVWFGAE